MSCGAASLLHSSVHTSTAPPILGGNSSNRMVKAGPWDFLRPPESLRESPSAGCVPPSFSSLLLQPAHSHTNMVRNISAVHIPSGPQFVGISTSQRRWAAARFRFWQSADSPAKVTFAWERFCRHNKTLVIHYFNQSLKVQCTRFYT